MPANWVLMAIPVGLLCLCYLIVCALEYVKEQRYLHAVFDGDRIQQWKADRYNHRHVKKLAACNGRRFY